jgi:hypothetical protein
MSLSKIDLFSIFRNLFSLSNEYFQLTTEEGKRKIKNLIGNFFNMKVSVFLKLCKCPFEFIDSLDSIDINIPMIDNLYALSFKTNDLVIGNIPSLNYIIDDNSVVEYLNLALRVNSDFISKYIEFKSQLIIFK